VARAVDGLKLGIYGLGLALTLVAAPPANARTAPAAPVCEPVLPPFMHCDALASHRSSRAVARAAGTVPSGYGPAELQDAYGLTTLAASAGTGQTVAVVDAYDNPNAEADLATYRSQFGLPACTTANGCFRKVNQAGGTAYPAPDQNWAAEISLDLQMVSAICPNCHLLLVEATSNSMYDLGAAVNTAAALGATQISNSYGGGENSAEITFDSDHFNHPGVAITVSSGDSGYGVEYPAASRYVTAVGGTSLVPAANQRGWSETAWSLTGSGCSAYISKPSWQHDASCARRTVADVSAVADPLTGVAVYDGGWDVYGGTSASAPIVAAAYALVGGAASSGSFAYDNPTWFNDVTSGSNGVCSGLYLCSGAVGFDGPTGMGTPSFEHPGETPVGGSGGPGAPGSGGAPGATSSPLPAANPLPAPPVRSSVAVSRGAVTATRSGKFKLRIACGHGPACKGVLNLQVPLRGGALRTIGKRSFSVQPGKTATLTVKLSRSGLRLLTLRRKLRVYGTALDSDGTTAQSSFALRAPKRSKHRRR
jgi:hypothetical protein